MSYYPTIKAAEVRPGDTVQWTRTEAGIVMKSIMEVAEIATVAEAVTSPDGFLVMKAVGGGERSFNQGDPVALVHRPEPKLPTEPGSHIHANLQGSTGLLTLSENREWWGVMFDKALLRHRLQSPNTDEITEWSEVTVTKAEP